MAGRAGCSGRKKDESLEKTIIEMWDGGYGVEEIAEAIGRTVETTRNRLGGLGLTDRKLTATMMKETGLGDRWEAECKWWRENVFMKA